IAHQHIKDRRAKKGVPVTPRGFVSNYVPFYFAPRSPMLYTIHHGNVAPYDGGQTKVLHLVSSVKRVLADGYPYCFTDGHAEMGPTLFYNDWKMHKDKVPWSVMTSNWWNDTADQPDRKRQRQAEFLVRDTFPWGAIESIGVYDESVRQEVLKIVAGTNAPSVTVQRAWYY
ncbi:MAG TPA: DUF4433 domain-containing protein, partial [Verrucomicrobiae bacterium]|nr:DUF4433 domain-containing protein [Verrucomicrobiae bacterium]